jgi:polar amino acid transport system substrate-binding protein
MHYRGSTAGILVLVLVLLDLFAAPARGQEAERLRVGIKEAPPFSMKDSDGNWRGISVEFWQWLGQDLKVAYDFEERTLAGLFDGLVDGSLDASIGALTVTAERERRVDFSHPYYQTGLGIAVTKQVESGPAAVFRRIFSADFARALGALVVLLFAVGIVVWLFERRRNRAQFGGGVKGLGASFWWSAVTMTTVGYGDKSPATLGGRLVALVWMFASIIVISGFTATIASSLTVSRLSTIVTGPEDLPKVRVASVPDSTSADYLVRHRIPMKPAATPLAALEAVKGGTADAAVYDAPVLRYLVNDRFPEDLVVLPARFDPQIYAIAVPEGSAIRERLNRAILSRVRSQAFDDLVFRYLGR